MSLITQNLIPNAKANRPGIGVDILLEWKNLGLRLPNPELVQSRVRPAFRTPNLISSTGADPSYLPGKLQEREILPKWMKVLSVTCVAEQPHEPQVTSRPVHRPCLKESVTIGTLAIPLLFGNI